MAVPKLTTEEFIALLRSASRYDWLREHMDPIDEVAYGMRPWISHLPVVTIAGPEGLDAAIDAAMLKD